MAGETPVHTPAWRAIGIPLMKVLGMEGQKITALDIRLAVGEPVVVTTTQYEPQNRDVGTALQRVMRRYTLFAEDKGSVTAYAVNVADDAGVTTIEDDDHGNG